MLDVSGLVRPSPSGASSRLFPNTAVRVTDTKVESGDKVDVSSNTLALQAHYSCSKKCFVFGFILAAITSFFNVKKTTCFKTVTPILIVALHLKALRNEQGRGLAELW